MAVELSHGVTWQINGNIYSFKKKNIVLNSITP